MYDTREKTQESEQNVDQEVRPTTALQEYAKWWKDDGEDDFANIADMYIRLAQYSQEAQYVEIMSFLRDHLQKRIMPDRLMSQLQTCVK